MPGEISVEISMNQIFKQKKAHKRKSLNKILLICFLLFLNELFSNVLFNFSFRIIHKMQHHDYYSICVFLSYRLFYVPLIYLTVAPFLILDKRLAFYNIFVAFIAIWIYGILKLSYADWRPNYLDSFLVDSEHHCDIEYGNPSGHSIGAFCYWFIFARDVANYFSNKYVRKMIHVLLKSMAYLICLSRLYFGAHSINQIIMGMGIGYIIFLIGEIYENPLKDAIYGEIFSKDKKRRVWNNPLFIFWVFFNFVGALLFVFRFQKEKNNPEYFEEIINCMRVTNDPLMNFAVTVYVKASITGVFVWMFLGMQERSQNVYLQLNSLRKTSPFVFLWRLFLNFFPLIVLAKISSYKKTDEIFMIFKQVCIVPVLSYCYGRFYGVYSRRIWIYSELTTEKM